MIVYLDTSSLVKLYVEEDGSPTVDRLVRSSEAASASTVAYAEARAAFARRFREKSFTQGEYGHIKTVFEKDWSRYLVLGITENRVVLAGDLLEKYTLRGFDSIQQRNNVPLFTLRSRRLCGEY